MPSTKNLKGDLSTTGDELVLKFGSNPTTLTATSTSSRTINLPDAAGTLAGKDIAQEWTANQTFNQTALLLKGGDANTLNIKVNETLTGSKTLNIQPNDADRTLDLSGNLVLGGTLTTTGAWTQTGAHTIGITTTGNTTITLPTSGTLASSASMLLNDSNASHTLQLAWNEDESSADRTLNLTVNGADRAIALTGDLTLGANLTTATGAVTLTGDASGSSLTLQAGTQVAGGNSNGGDLLTRTGTQSGITNKTFTALAITAGSTIDTSASGTLGIGNTNATTITIGQSGQTTVIAGNLQVDGTTTTVNSTTLDVTDENITINNGGTKANAEGGGLTVDSSGDGTPWSTAPAILYADSTQSGWTARKGNGSSSEIVTLADNQTLTSKTLTTPTINTPVINSATTLGLQDVTTPSYDLFLSSDSNATALTADRTLTIDVNNADRNIDLQANLTVEATSTVNQDLTTDATPTFANVSIAAGGAVDAASAGALLIGDDVATSVQIGDTDVDTTIQGNLRFDENAAGDANLASNTIAKTDTVVVIGTSPSTTDLYSITGGAAGEYMILVNKSGETITIHNEQTASAGYILTGTGANISLADDASITLLYEGTSQRWHVLGGTGSGSGTGELNYIGNPSGAIGTSGWTNVGDLDIATTVAAADLPREQTDGVGLKITADANTQSAADYVYYDFDLDDVDTGRMLKIEWAQKVTETVSGDYNAGDLEVIIAAQSDRTTAIATPVVSAIPAKDGIFNTEFMSTSTTAVSLVIRATTDMATDAGIVISSVVVGPGKTSSGAVVESRTAYTPTLNSTTAVATRNAWWWRVGENMHVEFFLEYSNPGANSNLTLSLPSGYTINTSKSPAESTSIGKLGTFEWLDTGTGHKLGSLCYNDSSSVNFFVDTTNARLQSDDFALGDYVTGSFVVPITEWTGQGTMNALSQDNLTEGVAADSDWSLTNAGNATLSITETRIGDCLNVRGRIDFGSTVPTGGDLKLNLPSKYTIDTSKCDWLFSSCSYENSVGGGWIPGHAIRSGTTGFTFGNDSGTWDGDANIPVAPNQNDDIDFDFTFPVVEFAGSQSSLVGFTTATETSAGLIPSFKNITDVAYADLSFSAVGGGSVTVGATDVSQFKYMIIGNMCTVMFRFKELTVAGTVIRFDITMPSEVPSAVGHGDNAVVLFDNSGSNNEAAWARVENGTNVLKISRDGGASWSASTNGTYVYGQVSYPLT